MRWYTEHVGLHNHYDSSPYGEHNLSFFPIFNFNNKIFHFFVYNANIIGKNAFLLNSDNSALKV